MTPADMMALIHRFQEITACAATMRQSTVCSGCAVLELLQKPLALTAQGLNLATLGSDESLAGVTRAHIAKILHEEKGNVTAAAKRLQIHRVSLLRKSDVMSIPRRRKRSPRK